MTSAHANMLTYIDLNILESLSRDDEHWPFAWKNRLFRCESKWYGSFRWTFFPGKKVIPSEIFPNQPEFPKISHHLSITWRQAFCVNISEKKCKMAPGPRTDISKLRIKWYGSIRSISLERSSAVPFVHSTGNSIQIVNARRQRQRQGHKQWSDWLNEEK